MTAFGDRVSTGEVRDDRPDERRMSFFEHLEELRKRFKVVLIVVLVLFAFFLIFSLQPFQVGSVTIYLPVPGFLFPDPTYGNDPISSQVFRALVDYLKPPWVNLTAGEPWSGVVVQFKTALFLAVVIASPIITYQFAKFIGPGLRPSERRMIARIAAPVLVLFLIGVFVGLLFILPFTFEVLYTVQKGLGVDVYLLFVDDFISFVLTFLIAFGLAFELPAIMFALTEVHVVTPEFWAKNWRYAAIAIFVFGAMITPDGSGVTMVIVAAPMLVLYASGYLVIQRRQRALMTRAKSS